MKRLFNLVLVSGFSAFAIVPLAGVLNSAGAEEIQCTGDYFFYHFNITAKSKGNAIDGKMNLVVTQGGSLVRKGAVPVSSSDIVIGRYLKFAGSDSSGGGQVQAQYNGRTYTGTLAVKSPEGSANVDVDCNVR